MQTARDIALKMITEGAKQYNNAQNYNDKSQARALYLKGLENLVIAIKRTSSIVN